MTSVESARAIVRVDVKRVSSMFRVPGVTACAAAALLATTALAQSAAPQPAPAQPAAASAPAAGPQDIGVAAPAGIAEGLAAVVNDEIISTYDLRQRMLLLIVSSGVRPTEETLPALEREALRSLVDERLQVQEFEERTKEKIPEDAVEEELQQIAQQSGTTKERLLAQLAAQGISADTLRNQLRAEVGWRILIRELYGRRLRIGDEQIRAAQQRIAANADKPQYQVSEIFIDASRVGGQSEAVSGAEQLIFQMERGAPFPAVARQFSAAATAANGGDAGWLTSGQIQPELEQVLAQMRPGQLSRPIPVQDGVWILSLRDKRAGAGAELVNLRQIALRVPAGASETDVAAARDRLEAIRPAITSCADLERQAATVQGAVAGDLGEAQVSDLAPAFREAAQTLQPNQVSAPIRTSVGLHLVAVCGKRRTGADAPSREQIENRLYGQQLAMLSRRYLRDLRSQATIEGR
jgi:peptidyl-prolyl cis-trans isomerase SurA